MKIVLKNQIIARINKKIDDVGAENIKRIELDDKEWEMFIAEVRSGDVEPYITLNGGGYYSDVAQGVRIEPVGPKYAFKSI